MLLNAQKLKVMRANSIKTGLVKKNTVGMTFLLVFSKNFKNFQKVPVGVPEGYAQGSDSQMLVFWALECVKRAF